MNKLYEDKRYDDVVRVFDHKMKSFVPSDVKKPNLELVLDALVQQVFKVSTST